MKVIVGSHDLWPTPSIASRILSIMVSTDEQFSVRMSKDRLIASGVEEIVVRIGMRTQRSVLPWAPTETGSSAAFKRDVSMVKDANQVYAFFAPDRLMEGGTGHVVACALRSGKPVVAYELDDNGEVVETASEAGDMLDMYEDQGPPWVP